MEQSSSQQQSISPAVMLQEPSRYCAHLWDQHNLPVEVAFSVVVLMFIGQAIYACKRRHRLALQFDIIMAVGCAVPIGIWS